MPDPQIVFWLAIVVLVYTYLGYPALVYGWALLRPRKPRRERLEPHVSVLVVAYNEAMKIDARLENLLSINYPHDRLEIVIGCDGCNDDTVAHARAYEHAGVRVMAFPIRRGKAAVLNDLMRAALGEIAVLADARQRFEPDAVRALATAFGDPEIGAVSGELILSPEGSGRAVGEGVGFYWRYEKFNRRHESQVDSTVGATGAIYAIRRHLFEPIPDDTILDDVLIPMRIAQRGYRVVFEPGARAYDRAAATADEEFTRKVRTIAGNFQLFARESWLLNPRRNRLWLQTVSHKGLRLLSPLFLVTLLAANVALLDGWFYRWSLVAQLGFYAAALEGHVFRQSRCKLSLLAVPYTFCFLNWATVVAFCRVTSGGQRVTWERAR